MKILFAVLEISIFGYFFYVSLYSFILSFSSLFKLSERKNSDLKKRSICILIPAYKEDNVIMHTALDVRNQKYNTELFDTFIIADSFKTETLKSLKRNKIKTIEVSFEKSTKVKAIRFALDQIDKNYDILLILDADNIMDQFFLKNINKDFNSGYCVIQGKRSAKNENSSLSFLDEISEQINNSILRKGTCNLGGSSAISGSGFAMDFELGKKAFNEIDSIGGFDKEIELYFIANGYKVHYNPKAFIYDEKVSSIEVFETQRKRWISSQFFYLKKYFSSGISFLLKGNFVYFNSGVLRYAQLPRLLNLGIFTIIVCVLMLPFFTSFVDKWMWCILYFLFILSILFAIPREFYSKKLVLSILTLPMVFISMFKLLFKLKGANKNFIHTEHNENQV